LVPRVGMQGAQGDLGIFFLRSVHFVTQQRAIRGFDF
jgi:hypothetical protein